METTVICAKCKDVFEVETRNIQSVRDINSQTQIVRLVTEEGEQVCLDCYSEMYNEAFSDDGTEERT